jgi:2-polyprenyl-3-methyl-5-hydroxy-6-metoxy-1,4-benzoquinol methylase
MKSVALGIAGGLGSCWRVVPRRWRRFLLQGLFVLESRGRDSGAALARLFAVLDDLELVVNERALAYGRGEHPKHRLIGYHEFFIDRIKDGERVLDVGCGYGAVARALARARPNSAVMGLDYHPGRLAQAKAGNNPNNLLFVESDATKVIPDGPWDVVILSNVLEHLLDRPNFLKVLMTTSGAGRFLIRVPLFERDWKMPMRREVGANYFSDPDHKIEHTAAEFTAEMAAAGLEAMETVLLWGEIWAVVRPAAVTTEPASSEQ